MRQIVLTPQLVTCAGEGPKAGAAMGEVGVILDGALIIQDDRIEYSGSRRALPTTDLPSIDVAGAVVPGLCDAHSHPLWAGSRLHEFEMRAQGATYQEIHAAGGGIAATVTATRQASDDDLRGRVRAVLARMLQHGTTTVECKSGYGLSAAEEERHLRLLQELDGHVPMTLVRTFLGAHALPPDIPRERYVDAMVAMMPRVVSEGLAQFCDVFCEEGAFTWPETHRILTAAKAAGLQLRIHAEEFSWQGAARGAAALGAVSCDHLFCIRPDDYPVLREHGTIATLMPGTMFFLGHERYAPARGLIEANVPVALGTDFNAGSCMSESMAMAMSLAVLKMAMTPAEALIAATVNSAWAVGKGQQVGSLSAGKQADFLVLAVDDYREWPYHFGVNMVRQVWQQGVQRWTA
ncbi:MAG TPA: imidazolonepropionase [Candidatus Xenobia bacterium]|jgi:imidazolonepropionase